MARGEHRKTSLAPRLPGDGATQEEEQAAKRSTIDTIRAELDAQREAEQAHLRAKAAEYAKDGVHLAIPEDITLEQRAIAHASTVDLIKAEMEANNAENGNAPRVMRQGLDDASMDLIKAEMAKAKRRIVLPSG